MIKMFWLSTVLPHHIFWTIFSMLSYAIIGACACLHICYGSFLPWIAIIGSLIIEALNFEPISSPLEISPNFVGVITLLPFFNTPCNILFLHLVIIIFFPSDYLDNHPFSKPRFFVINHLVLFLCNYWRLWWHVDVNPWFLMHLCINRHLCNSFTWNICLFLHIHSLFTISFLHHCRIVDQLHAFFPFVPHSSTTKTYRVKAFILQIKLKPTNVNMSFKCFLKV